ncbi:hypothetical protein O7623_03765 [Solwaraspora sp. WMMD791]|uniref:hypothetical protein n=1 Tax=Solwaraspora sp. WMMD791 TaxID=3016086 RepID=UPI00249B1786|nr:hypothetical protein [Solwaraspora sp. WMMD791]WFE28340.1 hypothetical protein O7623_03765 [Solwaraspora sp. WMMD791]
MGHVDSGSGTPPPAPGGLPSLPEVFGVIVPVVIAAGTLIGYAAGGVDGVAIFAPISAILAPVVAWGWYAAQQTRVRQGRAAVPLPWSLLLLVLMLPVALVVWLPSASGQLRPEDEKSPTPIWSPTPSPTPTPTGSPAPTPTPTPTQSPTPSPSPTEEPVLGWPTDANDGPPKLWAYFGSEFFFPDWVSCHENDCLAGEGTKVHVYTLDPLGRDRTFRGDVADPYTTLLSEGFTAQQAYALLEDD